MRRVAFILILKLTSFDGIAQSGVLHAETLADDNIQREYLVYVPAHRSPESNTPMVLAFHGGGGTAKGAMKLYNFNALADREGFIVVYPTGIDKSWNDGRHGYKKTATSDDLGFVSLLIDKMVKQYSIDPKRVFLTGLSNGAMFSIYLASKLSDKILAIAPVCGSMPVDIEKDYELTHPMSALFINGTDDKLVRYQGGPVLSQNAGRGEVIGIEKVIVIWMKLDGASENPKVKPMPDTDTRDNCKAELKTWSCPTGVEINFIKITGGGHTWPGGRQYLPKMMVGNVCRDFRAEEFIWEFFKRQK